MNASGYWSKFVHDAIYEHDNKIPDSLKCILQCDKWMPRDLIYNLNIFISSLKCCWVSKSVSQLERGLN